MLTPRNVPELLLQSRVGRAFLAPDLKTLVGRIMKFADADKIRELIGRTPTPMNLEVRNMFEHSIAQGRGGLYLELTDEQDTKLRKGK